MQSKKELISIVTGTKVEDVEGLKMCFGSRVGRIFTRLNMGGEESKNSRIIFGY